MRGRTASSSTRSAPCRPRRTLATSGAVTAGLHGTLCHIVWAEELWLTRWLARPGPAVAQGKDLATLAAARARWERVVAERGVFLAAFSERRLGDTVVVRPTTGGEFVHTFRQMFRHTVDHSSYHRGQLVTLLRQLGIKPPGTGLIGFYRQARPLR